MDELKREILSRLRDEIPDGGTDVRDYRTLVRKKTVEIVRDDVRETVEAEIWSDAIQAALDETGSVQIPDMGKPIFLDGSILMRSGCTLRAAKEQQIVLAPDAGVCMLRNEHLLAGNDRAVSLSRPDSGISVTGGIWTSLGSDNGNARLASDRENPIPGAWAIMLLSNVTDLVIRDVTFCDGCSYAVQICNAERFYLAGLHFRNYHKDGVHVNGPAGWGVIKGLSGDDMGDDMVALNAWDWHSSAMTFGTIHHLYVSNVVSTNNELRLLPGQKVYDDGSCTDCDICDCHFENLSGIYTYKLYAQPYWLNEIKGLHDVSGTVGRIRNVSFRNIEFPRIAAFGFGQLIAVKGLFEICADCSGITIENVRVQESIEALRGKDITLVKVGPLSATVKLDPDDPTQWGELFDPDAVCTAEDITVRHAVFDGVCAAPSDADRLIRAIRLTVNEDYPNTTPRGGTGYGIIRSAVVEA